MMNKASDRLLKHRKTLLAFALLAIAVGLFWPDTDAQHQTIAAKNAAAKNDQKSKLSNAEDDSFVQALIPEPVEPYFQEFSDIIESGDTLGSIFNQLNLPQATLYKLMNTSCNWPV